MHPTQSLQELLEEGRRLLETGDRARALAYFQMATQLSPEDSSIWHLRANAAADPEEAAGCLEEVLALNPEDALAREKLTLYRTNALQAQAKAKTIILPKTSREMRWHGLLSSASPMRSWMIGLVISFFAICFLLGAAVPLISLFWHPASEAEGSDGAASGETTATAVASSLALKMPATWTPAPTWAATATAVPSPTPAWMIERNVNVRSGPSTAYSILGTLTQGTLLIIEGRSPDSKFLQIQYPDQRKLAWVSADFVSIGREEVAMLPVPAVLPTLPPTRIPTVKPTPKPSDIPVAKIDFALGRSLEYIADCSKPWRIMGTVYESQSNPRRLNGIPIRIWVSGQLQGTVSTGSLVYSMIGFWEWSFSQGAEITGQVAVVNPDGSLRSEPVGFHLTSRCDGAGAVNQTIIDFVGTH